MAAHDEQILATISEHAVSLLRIARRHSLCADDAQDAYQRTLELFLRHREEIRPASAGQWLRTVAKNEAIRLQEARRRLVSPEAETWDHRGDDDGRDAAERAVEMERVAHAAEALQGCKPDESTAILLKAGGASYADIEARTGWSYTKVNRALTEGRRRFLQSFADIESGAACASYAPVLSLVADGEATAEDYVALRPHLRHCGGCRATLRGLYDAQPALGALVPAAVLAGPALAASPAAAEAPARLFTRVYEAAVTGAGDRLMRAQALVEAVTTSKAAAVAATAAVAAGGVVTVGGAGPELPPGNPAIARAVGPAGTAVRERTVAQERLATGPAGTTTIREAADGTSPSGRKRRGGGGAGRSAAARARTARGADTARDGRSAGSGPGGASPGGRSGGGGRGGPSRAGRSGTDAAASRTGRSGTDAAASQPAATVAPSAANPAPARTAPASPAPPQPAPASASVTAPEPADGDFGFEG